MSMPISRERKLLSEAEFALVEPSHYPALSQLDREALLSLAERLRAARDGARSNLATLRRAKRTKAEPVEGLVEPGTAAKKQVFAAALRRVTKRLEA